MEEKQKVNDKCNCESGKKYKKCCMNNPKESDSRKESDSSELSDTPHIRHAIRNIIRNHHMQMPYANKPHCEICGDTIKDGPLIKCMLISGGSGLFCKYCYECQMRM
jgi:hypothetical protein